MGRRIVVAIDGPAGSGKSTTAKEVANHLGYLYLDTGAMYRALGLGVLRAGADPDDETQAGSRAEEEDIDFTLLEGHQRILLGGEDVTDLIRTPCVSDAASRVAVHPRVRQSLIASQRSMGRNGGIVLEGRDTGTVVFPNAELKVFLVADVEERARRRRDEMVAKGEQADLCDLVQQIRERDARDEETQLRSGEWPAGDAVQVDTTGMAIKDQVNQVLVLARQRSGDKV